MSFIPGLGRFLEKEMAAYSSILAWKILETEKPGGLQSMGLQELVTTELTHTHNPPKLTVQIFIVWEDLTVWITTN